MQSKKNLVGLFIAFSLVFIPGFFVGVKAQSSQVFDKPGTYTWTVPQDVTQIKVKVWGAGGAGGLGHQAANKYLLLRAAGGGGGGGGYAEGVLSVTPGITYEVIVGAGGEPGFTPDGSKGFSVDPKYLLQGGWYASPAGNSEFRVNWKNQWFAVGAGGGGSGGSAQLGTVTTGAFLGIGAPGKGWGGTVWAQGAGNGGWDSRQPNDPQKFPTGGGGGSGYFIGYAQGQVGGISKTGANGSGVPLTSGNGGAGAEGGAGGLAGSGRTPGGDGIAPGGGGGGSMEGMYDNGSVSYELAGSGADGKVVIEYLTSQAPVTPASPTFECRPVAESVSGDFRGNLPLPAGSATSGPLSTDKKFKIECWNTADPEAPHIFDQVEAKVTGPDLVATTPVVQWVSGGKTGQEGQNIFAEGATLRFSYGIKNEGKATAGASKMSWRAAETTIPDKVEKFGVLPPLVDTPQLAIGGVAPFVREIADVRVGEFGLGICADEEKKVDESNETNNCSGILKLKVVKVEKKSFCEENPNDPSCKPVTGGKWDGWIKMSGKTTTGADYGVRYDPQTTRFCGYAWGGAVVGWVSFGPLPGTATGCDQSPTLYQWARLSTVADAKIRPEVKKIELPNLTEKDALVFPLAYQLGGWAWSSNIGWISLSNANHAGTVNYGVTMDVKGDVQDKASGRSLKGWAWSSNIGWIKFDAAPFNFSRPNGEMYPDAPQKSATTNINTNMIEGWARVCAGTIKGDCNSSSRAD
ncbi:MAG: hypothetical protein FJY98_01265 [Candidatus Liptonbacteria bacterium]|nr:hypothetical protein [Candidatus Liptonbacteria bacterium]